MTAQLASRVMKARRESICLLCMRLVKPGDYIAKSGTWVHLLCLLGQLRARNSITEEKTT